MKKVGVEIQSKLNPCPFCGQIPTCYGFPRCDIISCENQECAVHPTFTIKHDLYKHDYSRLIEEWNRRVKK